MGMALKRKWAMSSKLENITKSLKASQDVKKKCTCQKVCAIQCVVSNPGCLAQKDVHAVVIVNDTL